MRSWLASESPENDSVAASKVSFRPSRYFRPSSATPLSFQVFFHAGKRLVCRLVVAEGPRRLVKGNLVSQPV